MAYYKPRRVIPILGVPSKSSDLNDKLWAELRGLGWHEVGCTVLDGEDPVIGHCPVCNSDCLMKESHLHTPFEKFFCTQCAYLYLEIP